MKSDMYGIGIPPSGICLSYSIVYSIDLMKKR